MPGDSRQLDILKRLTVHLQGITQENGYDFDLADNVFRGRLVFGDDAPFPLISIVEHLTADVSVNTAGVNNIMRQETWVLLVQGWLDHDSENPTDEAYNLKAAVEHRLARLILTTNGDPTYPDEYLLGVVDTITGIAIGPGVVSAAVQAGAGSTKSFFYLPVGITLGLDISDPFIS